MKSRLPATYSLVSFIKSFSFIPPPYPQKYTASKNRSGWVVSLAHFWKGALLRFALLFKKQFFTEHFQRIVSSLDIFLCMPQLSALLNVFLKKHVYMKNLPHVFLGTCFFEDYVILYEINLTKFAIKFFERCFPFGFTWLRNLVSGQLPPG